MIKITEKIIEKVKSRTILFLRFRNLLNEFNFENILSKMYYDFIHNNLNWVNKCMGAREFYIN